MSYQELLLTLSNADNNHRAKNYLDWNLKIQDKLNQYKLRSLLDLINIDPEFAIKMAKSAKRLKLA